MDWMVIWRCAPLSATCSIDWDAWAAIATALGVLTALGAPVLAKMLTRRRANALFALAYKRPLNTALEHLTQICKTFHEGYGTQEEAWEAEAVVMTNAEEQSKLAIKSGGIVRLAEIDLDLSRWPESVSLDLAASVASAINACRDVEATMLNGAHIGEAHQWNPFWLRFRKDLVVAVHILIAAVKKVEQAGNALIDERLVRHRAPPSG